VIRERLGDTHQKGKETEVYKGLAGYGEGKFLRLYMTGERE